MKGDWGGTHKGYAEQYGICKFGGAEQYGICRFGAAEQGALKITGRSAGIKYGEQHCLIGA